jgi:hypothetical protein
MKRNLILCCILLLPALAYATRTPYLTEEEITQLQKELGGPVQNEERILPDYIALEDLTKLPKPTENQPKIDRSPYEGSKRLTSVDVLFFLGKDGTVDDVIVLSADFEQVADYISEIIMNWEFYPGEKDGKEVAVYVKLTIPCNVDRILSNMSQPVAGGDAAR